MKTHDTRHVKEDGTSAQRGKEKEEEEVCVKPRPRSRILPQVLFTASHVEDREREKGEKREESHTKTKHEAAAAAGAQRSDHGDPQSVSARDSVRSLRTSTAADYRTEHAAAQQTEPR